MNGRMSERKDERMKDGSQIKKNCIITVTNAFLYLRPFFHVMIDHLGGRARDEALCQPEEVRRDFGVAALRRRFGPYETVGSLRGEFYARMQSKGETPF